MKFSQEDPTDDYRVQSYQTNCIFIKQGLKAEPKSIDKSFILMRDRLVVEPEINPLSSLSEHDINYFKNCAIEVLIIGQSSDIRLPLTLLATFSQHGIGVEKMGIGAACRTYNLLISEGRQVALVVDFS